MVKKIVSWVLEIARKRDYFAPAEKAIIELFINVIIIICVVVAKELVAGFIFVRIFVSRSYAY